jgi:hypothetical protein
MDMASEEWSPVVEVEWSGDGTRECERVQGLERLRALELSGTVGRAIRFTGGRTGLTAQKSM